MIYKCEVQFVQTFKERYLRNNKTNGSKNLRCFPQCLSSHFKQGFCGQPVFARLIVEYQLNEQFEESVESLTIVGEFQPCSHEFDGINFRIAESHLLKNSIGPNNKYHTAKTRVVQSECIDQSRKIWRKILELKFECKPWQYSWAGNKVRQTTQHAFVVSVLIPSPSKSSDGVTYLNVLKQVQSPSFQVSCMRRNTPKALSLKVPQMETFVSHNDTFGAVCGDSDCELDSLLTYDLSAHQTLATTSVRNVTCSPAEEQEDGLTTEETAASLDSDSSGYHSDAFSNREEVTSRQVTAPCTPKRSTSACVSMHTVTPEKKPREYGGQSETRRSTDFRNINLARRSPFSLECAAISLDSVGDNNINSSRCTQPTFSVAPHSLSLSTRKQKATAQRFFQSDDEASEWSSDECASAVQSRMPAAQKKRARGESYLSENDDSRFCGGDEIVCLPMKPCYQNDYINALQALQGHQRALQKKYGVREVRSYRPEEAEVPCTPVVNRQLSSLFPQPSNVVSDVIIRVPADTMMASRVVHGLPLFPTAAAGLSVATQDDLSPVDRLPSPTAAPEESGEWSPEARRRQHKKLLKRLFPNLDSFK